MTDKNIDNEKIKDEEQKNSEINKEAEVNKETVTEDKTKKGNEKTFWVIIAVVIIVVLAGSFILYSQNVTSKAKGIASVQSQFESGETYEYTSSEGVEGSLSNEVTFRRDGKGHFYLKDGYYQTDLGFSEFYFIDERTYGCNETVCERIKYQDQEKSELDLEAFNTSVGETIKSIYSEQVNGASNAEVEITDESTTMTYKMYASESTSIAGQEVGARVITISNDGKDYTDITKVENEDFKYQTNDKIEFKDIDEIKLPFEVQEEV